MRVLQFGEDAHFPQEAVGYAGEGELGPEHLEGDRPVVPDVGRDPDARHAALPELALEGVAVTEFSFDHLAEAGHAALPGGLNRE